MLETLYDIDWGSYDTAFGTADVIPRLLEALTSPDDAVVTHAAQELDEALYHQGEAYESILPTIPFLVEILEQSNSVAAQRIMVLLNSFRLPQRPQSEAGIALEKRIIDAVRVGLPLYTRYLEHGDFGTRAMATELYTSLHEDRLVVFNWICRRLKVNDSLNVRLLNTLGRLIARREVPEAAIAAGTKLLEEMAESEENLVVAIESMIVLVGIFGSEISVEIPDRLVNKLLLLVDLQDESVFRLIPDASHAFKVLSLRERVRLRIRLLEGCDTKEMAYILARRLLEDAFAFGQTTTTLTHVQQRVLSAFVKKELLWRNDMLGRKLKNYGLPGDCESLKHFVTA